VCLQTQHDYELIGLTRLSVGGDVYLYIRHMQVTENVAASVLGIERRFTELCIYEIIASDNRTLEEALAAFNESLFSVNGTQDDGPSSLTELMSSSDVRDILKAATSQVCPGQPACSGRGTCRNSVCTCNTGHHTYTPCPEKKRPPPLNMSK